jgi:hypothetical protein
MQGDATLFALEDYVEEAWRIVDPVLKDDTPVYEYEPGTWGPKEVESSVTPPGGWQNPTVDRPVMRIEALADADSVARSGAAFTAAEARAAAAWDLVQAFLAAEFSHAPRHSRRLSRAASLELQPTRTHP